MQTNITGVCGEYLQCMDHNGFAPAHWHFPSVLSWSTLLRLQVALQGNCPKWALSFVHFPGLSCSGSGSRVLHKGADSVGPAFCAIPGPSSSGDQVLGACSYPQLEAASYHLSCASHLVFWVCNRCVFSGVQFVSSGELISGCDPPGGCRPSRNPKGLG